MLLQLAVGLYAVATVVSVALTYHTGKLGYALGAGVGVVLLAFLAIRGIWFVQEVTRITENMHQVLTDTDLPTRCRKAGL